jgi:hypothetical protein
MEIRVEHISVFIGLVDTNRLGELEKEKGKRRNDQKIARRQQDTCVKIPTHEECSTSK